MTNNLSTPEKQQAQQADNAWRILIVLFLINLLNFFDRTIPAVVFEPIRLEFGLSDAQLGILSAAFTLVYAIAGIPLGRLADNWSRKNILAGGLIVWSGLTAATGAAWNYTSMLLVRVGVGIGEASCAPAAMSMIGDMFPSSRRAKAMGIYMLGLPLGLVLAFFAVGPIVAMFDNSWRAPFFIAAIPGIALGFFVFFIKEPTRGAAETTVIKTGKVDKPFRKILRVKTVWWIIVSGIAVQMAGYSGNGFIVALLQRYFVLDISDASLIAGGIVGITGLIALTIGAQISDKINQKSPKGRIVFGAVSMFIAAGFTFWSLQQEATELKAFALLFGFGWLLYYNYFTTVYPAIQDVVEPRLRATAVAVYFAGQYLLGGALGPFVLGLVSDNYAQSAMAAAGATEMTEQFKAFGLHQAMYLVPITLLMTGLFLLIASQTFEKDRLAMLSSLK